MVIDEKSGVSFDQMPMLYWDAVTRISFLQRRLLVYSLQYYLMSENVISDQQFDALAFQLVRMQKEDPSAARKSAYWYVFNDFEGSTGFYLPGRLNASDKAYLTLIAERVLQVYKRKCKRK